MSYTSHTWTDGETITAAKLNNIEEGIAEAAESGGGGLTLIPWEYDNETSKITLSMTFQDMMDGMVSGSLYAFRMPDDELGGWNVSKGVFLTVGINESNLDASFGDYYFMADSASGYLYCYVGD